MIRFACFSVIVAVVVRVNFNYESIRLKKQSAAAAASATTATKIYKIRAKTFSYVDTVGQLKIFTENH